MLQVITNILYQKKICNNKKKIADEIDAEINMKGRRRRESLIRRQKEYMRDFVELASSIDSNLSVMKQREIVCDALLEDLQALEGKDLAPYLLECAFDVVEPGTRFVLKFPIEMR